VVIGILLSHRIAGPIYRISKYIDSLKTGDYSEDIRLRKKDELKDLAVKMTELCHVLRENKEKINSARQEIIEELEKSGTNAETKENIKTKLNALAE